MLRYQPCAHEDSAQVFAFCFIAQKGEFYPSNSSNLIRAVNTLTRRPEDKIDTHHYPCPTAGQGGVFGCVGRSFLLSGLFVLFVSLSSFPGCFVVCVCSPSFPACYIPCVSFCSFLPCLCLVLCASFSPLPSLAVLGCVPPFLPFCVFLCLCLLPWLRFVLCPSSPLSLLSCR